MITRVPKRSAPRRSEESFGEVVGFTRNLPPA
jgi:hypothetical protein